MKLILLKGLPASGKSTWAKERVLSDTNQWKRVNKDEIRKLVHCGQWSGKLEKFVESVEYEIADKALTEGYNVIVDDTNFHPKHPERFRNLAGDMNADYEEKFFEVSLDEAVERDLKRPNPVGERVIRKMYNQYVRPKRTAPEYDPAKTNAVIVDIDGTLAHIVGDDPRSPYDYARVHEDALDDVIYGVALSAAERGDKLLIVSGREDDCRDVTEAWLEKHGIVYDELHMRKAGDHRKDSIVKKEIYENEIKPRYNVRFVLDDRNQVVEMWRDQGLVCLQVAEGDF